MLHFISVSGAEDRRNISKKFAIKLGEFGLFVYKFDCETMAHQCLPFCCSSIEKKDINKGKKQKMKKESE